MQNHAVRRHAPLLAILLAAFGARLAWALLVESGTRQSYVLDATFYDRVARDLVQGRGYLWPSGEPTAYHPPGYPFLLAAAYRVFGPGLLTAKLLNVVLGTLTCGLVFALGARAYGRPVGLVAAALFACWPGDVFYASTTLSEVSFTFALTAALLLFVRWSQTAGSRWRWLVLGALLGCAVMLRGVALFFPLVFVTGWSLGGTSARATLARSGLALLGIVAVLSPWAIRNQLVLGRPVLVSTGIGYALFNAHSPAAAGTQTFEADRLREKLFPDLQSLPRGEKELALSSAQVRYAVRWMLTHPLDELRLIPQRIAALYAHDHFAFFVLGHMDPRSGARWTRVADAFFHAMLALACVGAWLSVAGSRSSFWVVPLAVAYFNVLHAFLLAGSARYHAPMVPLLAILAALALVRVWRRLAGGARLPQGVPGSGAAAGSAAGSPGRICPRYYPI